MLCKKTVFQRQLWEDSGKKTAGKGDVPYKYLKGRRLKSIAKPR